MIKIWQRAFILELLETFLLFIVIFWGLYVLIDYSSRSAHHWIARFSLPELFAYYSFLFVERLDIIIPFALVIASVKTYTSINTRSELIALMGSGVPLKKLLRPFLFVGALFTLLLLFSNEFLLPLTNHKSRLLKALYLSEKEQSTQNQNIQLIQVLGGGEALYHHFDLNSGYFFDFYWVKSEGEIWRARRLFPTEMPPRGELVEHFVRGKSGELLLERSAKTELFPGLTFEPMELKRARIQPKEESMSSLFRELREMPDMRSELKDEIQATLLHKLIMPFLALFAVLAPAPFCLRFSRDLPIFMLFFSSIALLVTFYLVMNAALILGENGVINPLFALTVPPLVYGATFLYKYWEMK